nr:hypothetical protein [Tanacetum cinerariifolium]
VPILRYRGLEYYDQDIADFKERMRMKHRDSDGVVVFTCQEGDAGGVAEEALVAPSYGDKDEEMPQAVPPPPRTQSERIARLEEEVHSMREVLQDQREVLDSMARDFSKFVTWTVTSLSRMMDKAGVTYMRYFESLVEYQKRNVRRRTNGAGTFAAPQ